LPLEELIVVKEKGLLNNELKALKLIKADFEKLAAKAQKKRDKELEQYNQKTSGMSREDLADLYGYGNISIDEYDEALKRLDDDKQQGQEAMKTTPTALYLKMLYRDIKDTETEIYEIEEELGIKHPASESRDERRKRLGLEPK
jgi:hypothetical protein